MPLSTVPAGRSRCATAIRDGAQQLGIQVRTGLHTGEIELRPDDITGLAVVIAQRISAIAQANEILVSSTVRDLTVGSTIGYEARGEHELKGVPDAWTILAAARLTGSEPGTTRTELPVGVRQVAPDRAFRRVLGDWTTSVIDDQHFAASWSTRRGMVRRTGTGYECTVCGETLSCGPDATPRVIIVQSGGKPTTRRILCDGEEVHHCKIGDLRVPNSPAEQA